MAARKQCLWHFIVLPLASQRITPPFALSSLANGESYLRSQGLVVIRTISTTHSLLFLKKSSAAAAASALALSLMPTAAATLLFSFSFPFSFSFTFSLCIAKNAVACFAFFSPSSFFSSVLLSRLSYWLKGLKGEKREAFVPFLPFSPLFSPFKPFMPFYFANASLPSCDGGCRGQAWRGHPHAVPKECTTLHLLLFRAC